MARWTSRFLLGLLTLVFPILGCGGGGGGGGGFSLDFSLHLVFMDDFERSDGGLGPDWDTPGAEPVSIVANEACADEQAVAWYVDPVSGDHIITQLSFTAAEVESLECYVLADNDLDGGNGFFLAGFDGGAKALRIDGGGESATGPALVLLPNVRYCLQVEFHNGRITAILKDEAQNQIDLLILDTSAQFRPTYLGFLVGRTDDDSNTCADQFQIWVIEGNFDILLEVLP